MRSRRCRRISIAARVFHTRSRGMRSQAIAIRTRPKNSGRSQENSGHRRTDCVRCQEIQEAGRKIPDPGSAIREICGTIQDVGGRNADAGRKILLAGGPNAGSGGGNASSARKFRTLPARMHPPPRKIRTSAAAMRNRPGWFRVRMNRNRRLPVGISSRSPDFRSPPRNSAPGRAAPRRRRASSVRSSANHAGGLSAFGYSWTERDDRLRYRTPARHG
jgi:hypothetical protein